MRFSHTHTPHAQKHTAPLSRSRATVKNYCAKRRWVIMSFVPSSALPTRRKPLCAPFLIKTRSHHQPTTPQKSTNPSRQTREAITTTCKKHPRRWFLQLQESSRDPETRELHPQVPTTTPSLCRSSSRPLHPIPLPAMHWTNKMCVPLSFYPECHWIHPPVCPRRGLFFKPKTCLAGATGHFLENF